MLEIGKFAFESVLALLNVTIELTLKESALEFFKRRRIERRVEDSVADVVQSLLPFLSIEGVTQERQYRLIQTCVEELRPLTATPEVFFQASLNGQKIFDNLYAD